MISRRSLVLGSLSTLGLACGGEARSGLLPERVLTAETGVTASQALVVANAATRGWFHVKLAFRDLVQLASTCGYAGWRMGAAIQGALRFEVMTRAGPQTALQRVLNELATRVGATVTVDGVLDISGFVLNIPANVRRDAGAQARYDRIIARARVNIAAAETMQRQLAASTVSSVGPGLADDLIGDYVTTFNALVERIGCNQSAIVAGCGVVGGGTLTGNLRLLAFQLSFTAECLGGGSVGPFMSTQDISALLRQMGVNS